MQVASAIIKAGGEAIVVAGDVTATEFPEQLLSATMKHYNSIDILVNNAGRDIIVHQLTFQTPF